MPSRSRSLALSGLVVLALAAGCGDDEQTVGAPAEGDQGVAATQTAPEQPSTTPAAPEEPGTAPSTQATERRDCGEVAFAPNTDAGAFEITAVGVDCELARTVATAAEGAGRRFSAQGFTCEGTRREGALPSVDFTCRRDGERIRFSVS